MMAALKRLPVDELSRESDSIARRVLALPQVQRASGVAVFLSMDQEVQTLSLLDELLRLGKHVSVPVIEAQGDSTMLQMRFARFHAGAELAKDKWGIPSLQGAVEYAHESDLDVIMTPGLAFDANRQRLGRGKGFYDKFFKAVDASRAAIGLPKTFKVGLALSFQLVRAVPVDAHDVALDVVVTADDTYV